MSLLNGSIPLYQDIKYMENMPPNCWIPNLNSTGNGTENCLKRPITSGPEPTPSLWTYLTTEAVPLNKFNNTATVFYLGVGHCFAWQGTRPCVNCSSSYPNFILTELIL